MTRPPAEIIFMTEEPSMAVLLEHLLPSIIPAEVHHRIIRHQGKQDLQASIPRKLRAWNKSAHFVIVHDQDSHDCLQLKAHLLALCQQSGRADSLVRIVCHELESWFLGDLHALELAYQEKGLAKLQSRKKYWQPDRLANAKQELRKLIPAYQPAIGSRAIAPHLSLDNDHNRSHSFHVFLRGIRCLVDEVQL